MSTGHESGSDNKHKLIESKPDEQRIEHQLRFHSVKQFEMHFLNDHKLHKQEPSCMPNSKIK